MLEEWSAVMLLCEEPAVSLTVCGRGRAGVSGPRLGRDMVGGWRRAICLVSGIESTERE